MLRFISDNYKNQKILVKLSIIVLIHRFCSRFLIAIRPRKCVLKLLILILLQYNSFLNDIRHKSCVVKLLIHVLLYFILFLANVRPNKYKVVSKEPLSIASIDRRLKKCVIKLLIIFCQH